MLTSTLLLRTAPLQFSFGSFRRSLTHYESALAYAFLGIIAGVLSGAAVIAFEHAIGIVEPWDMQSISMLSLLDTNSP